jgi:hypothetical protein
MSQKNIRANLQYSSSSVTLRPIVLPLERVMM